MPSPAGVVRPEQARSTAQPVRHLRPTALTTCMARRTGIRFLAAEPDAEPGEAAQGHPLTQLPGGESVQ